ncbi:MAG: helix-turn-helix domain-containing protein [Pseudomonadota bacterium]
MTSSVRVLPFDADLNQEAHRERSPSADTVVEAVIKHARAGQILYHENDAAPYCYQIITGAVKEYNSLKDGRRQVSEFYGPGDLFGVCELEHHSHTAEAIVDCTLKRFSRDAYLTKISASPDLSRQLLRTLMTRLHRARERLIMLGRMSAVQRLATFFLRLSNDQETRDDIRLAMSRQDIADHLGLTIETVCRAITELKKKRIITMKTARLFAITDHDALSDIAAGRETN